LHQQLVAQALARLHDAHNSSIDLHDPLHAVTSPASVKFETYRTGLPVKTDQQYLSTPAAPEERGTANRYKRQAKWGILGMWGQRRKTIATIQKQNQDRHQAMHCQSHSRTHVYSVQPHLILSVLQHLIICLFVFFVSLLELDAVDLDAEQLMRESAVVVENITVINFPSLNACATQSIHGHCTASSDFVTPPNQHAVLKFNTLPWFAIWHPEWQVHIMLSLRCWPTGYSTHDMSLTGLDTGYVWPNAWI